MPPPHRARPTPLPFPSRGGCHFKLFLRSATSSSCPRARAASDEGSPGSVREGFQQRAGFAALQLSDNPTLRRVRKRASAPRMTAPPGARSSGKGVPAQERTRYRLRDAEPPPEILPHQEDVPRPATRTGRRRPRNRAARSPRPPRRTVCGKNGEDGRGAGRDRPPSGRRSGTPRKSTASPSRAPWRRSGRRGKAAPFAPPSPVKNSAGPPVREDSGDEVRSQPGRTGSFSRERPGLPRRPAVHGVQDPVHEDAKAPSREGEPRGVP